MLRYLYPTKEKIIVTSVAIVLWFVLYVTIQMIIGMTPNCSYIPTSTGFDSGIHVPSSQLTPACSSILSILQGILIIPVFLIIPFSIFFDHLISGSSLYLLVYFFVAFPTMYIFVTTAAYLIGKKQGIKTNLERLTHQESG